MDLQSARRFKSSGMAAQSIDSLPKRAFYPCCANDIDEPRHLLAGLVEEIIYCDRHFPRGWTQPKSSSGLPDVRFIKRDISDYIDRLPLIHVFFYRRDSTGEGGSGLYILGKQWLGRILQHFPDEGGLIITDGSNRGSSIFKKMIRPSGYTRESWGCQFWPSPDQPWLETHRLYKIEMKRITEQSRVAG
jgi:hypothetical protein